MENKERLIIECGDGRLREVEFHTGSRLVKRSIIIGESPKSGEAIEKLGLSERQCKGLGIPPNTNPANLLPIKEDEDD